MNSGFKTNPVWARFGDTQTEQQVFRQQPDIIRGQSPIEPRGGNMEGIGASVYHSGNDDAARLPRLPKQSYFLHQVFSQFNSREIEAALGVEKPDGGFIRNKKMNKPVRQSPILIITNI